MATGTNDLAERARAIIGHYCEALSLPLSNFAESSGVDPSRLNRFMRGSLHLSSEECEGIGNLVAELADGEDWDVWETKMRGLTPGKTATTI